MRIPDRAQGPKGVFRHPNTATSLCSCCQIQYQQTVERSWWKKISFGWFECQTMRTSIQRAFFHVCDVQALLCRQHLWEKNATPAQPCCQPQCRWRICPLCTLPEVCTYIDGSILSWCVFSV